MHAPALFEPRLDRASLQSVGFGHLADGFRPVLSRLAQGAVNAPSEFQQALANTQTRNAKLLSPCAEGFGLPLERQHVVVALVSGLLGHRRPAAVIRFVWAVIVDAIQRVRLAWDWPHVFHKGAQGCAPAFAHGNTPPTVAVKRIVGFGVTPALHPKPDSVLPRLACAVRDALFSQCIITQAATALNQTPHDQGGGNYLLGAAFASPQPEPARVFAALWSDGSQSVVFLARRDAVHNCKLSTT